VAAPLAAATARTSTVYRLIVITLFACTYCIQWCGIIAMHLFSIIFIRFNDLTSPQNQDDDAEKKISEAPKARKYDAGQR
jgi:hypothetical protein